MSKSKVLTAIGAVIALGISTQAISETTPAEKSTHTTKMMKGMEKCYGITKAGKNDCGTSKSACAGTSIVDNQGDAWLLLPKGSCEKIVGGSTIPKA